MTTFTLRPWQRSDAEAVAAAANNPKIAANLRNVFPSPYTPADAEWFINDCSVKGEERQLARAIIIEKKVFGCVSDSLKDDVYEKSVERGYWLAEAWWGNGIMTEAFSAVIPYLFDVGFNRITAAHAVENPASGRVMQKCGLTYEGTLRQFFRAASGELLDTSFYAVLKEEFSSRKNTETI